MLTCIALHFKIVLEQMDQTIEAELERQQTSMLEKLSPIMNNKLESMKRQLEEASNTQMSDLKEIRLTES